MLASDVVPDVKLGALDAHCRLMGIKKARRDNRFDVVERILRSAGMFADQLAMAGIKVPMKISKTTGKLTHAFAKTDEEFLKLQAHPQRHVRKLFAARMAAKSTTALDKAIKLLAMSKHGPIPAYLNYWAAQTGRWSGGDKIQLQNMPRGGEMRKSLIAPKGHLLTVIDSSGIEMRMLAWLSDNKAMLADIAAGIDVYVKMASKIYDIPMSQIDYTQRFVGKVAILGLGYSMSAEKFQITLAIGTMGPPVQISLQEAQKVVHAYRTINWPVKHLWTQAEVWLKIMMADGNSTPQTYKGITFDTEKATLPDGTILYYPNMRGEYNHTYDSYGNFQYTSQGGKLTKYIYGALFVENLTQALARSVIAEQTLEVAKKIPCLLLVHDEFVGLTPIPMKDHVEHYMFKCFTKQPDWCKDLPLGAEYGTAREYSK